MCAGGLRRAERCLLMVAVGVNRRKLFKRRTVHGLIILGCVIYLQVQSSPQMLALMLRRLYFCAQFSIRTLQGLNCKSYNDLLVLRVEPSTECYTDGHLGTAYAPLSWPAGCSESCCWWIG